MFCHSKFSCFPVIDFPWSQSGIKTIFPICLMQEFLGYQGQQDRNIQFLYIKKFLSTQITLWFYISHSATDHLPVLANRHYLFRAKVSFRLMLILWQQVIFTLLFIKPFRQNFCLFFPSIVYLEIWQQLERLPNGKW